MAASAGEAEGDRDLITAFVINRQKSGLPREREFNFCDKEREKKNS